MEMTRSSKVALFFAALLTTAAASPRASLVLKYFVDIIAMGHSLAKTLALFSFCLLLSLAVKIAPKVSSKWPTAFLCCLGSFHLLSLTQYLWYCRSYGLKVNGWSAVVRDGFWTMSRLDHSHTAKAALSFLPRQLAAVTDVGFSFGAIFPQPMLLVLLMLFIGLLLLGVGVSLRALQRESAGRATSTVLAVYVLVKCAIDGGVLIPEFWAAIPVMAYLSWGKRGTQITGCLSAIYLLSLPIWKYGAVFIILLDWLPTMLALCVPMLLERSRKIGIVILILVVVSPIVRYQVNPRSRVYPFAINTIVYGNQTLQSGWEAYIVSPQLVNSVPGLFSIKSSTEDSISKYYLLKVTLEKDTNPRQLCQALGLELVRTPVSWYHGQVETKARLVFIEGSLESVLDSALILQSEVSGDRLKLRLLPGVNRDLALSMLGPGLTVVHEFSLSYPEDRK